MFFLHNRIIMILNTTVWFNFLIFFFYSLIMAVPQDLNNDAPIIISLGSNCQIAMQLKAHNFRTAAYPFDWIVTPFDALCAVLENDFEDFIDSSYLTRLPNKQNVIHSKYRIQFSHDFPRNKDGLIEDDWESYIETIQEKYTRRIERFRFAMKNAHHIYLICARTNPKIQPDLAKEEAIRLKNVIAKRYSNMNWHLIILDDNELIKEYWQIPQISNFHLKFAGTDLFAIGHGIKDDWTEIFMKLDLITNES